MKHFIAIAYLGAALLQHLNSFSQNPLVSYPVTRKVIQADTLFGQVIEDPYRWLEESSNDEIKQWVASQNKLTKEYLQKVPNSFLLHEQISRNTEVESFTPVKLGNYYFALRTAFGGKALKVYYTTDIKKGFWEELFISKDLDVQKGQVVSVDGFWISPNSKYIAYLFNKNGSDWKELKVANLDNQKNLTDHLYNIKFSSITWRGEGFYYQSFEKDTNGNEYKQALKNPKLYYHRLGTPQEQDSLIFKRNDAPFNFFYPTVSTDNRFLILEDLNRNNLIKSFYFFDFKDSTQKGLLPLIKKTEKIYHFLNSSNDELLFSMEEQGNTKIITINPKQPLKHREIKQKRSDMIVQAVRSYKDYFYEIVYYNQQQNLIVLNSQEEIIKKVEIPFGASCSFNGIDTKTNELLFEYESYLHPPVFASMNLTSFAFEILEPVKISYNMKDFVIEKVMYPSDTAMVPMLLMHLKNIKLDGTNPTLIEFYGGYGAIHSASYDAGKISFVENGGIYAYAMIRGGGEKGNYWHLDGKLFNRQHSIQDIIQAAEFLIKKGYTQPSKVAITGASHGGLMTAAAVMQRPDLFAAAVPRVGNYDMLRFEKFTIGSIHQNENGTVKDSLSFLNLKSFSPLHCVKKGIKYPAMLMMTSDYDDRVPPLHSYKMAATLQNIASRENPVLLRVEKNAGHNGARRYESYIDETTDFYSFILFALKVKKFCYE